MYISVQDLAFFIIFCLAATAGVFLIIALYNLISLIKRANKIIEINNENINKTLAVIPEVAKNVNDVALSLKNSADKVGETIEDFGEVVSETATSLSEGTENLLNFVKIVSGIVQVILGAFSSSGKK